MADPFPSEVFFFDNQGPSPRRVRTSLEVTQRMLEQEQSQDIMGEKEPGRERENPGDRNK